MGEDVTIRRPRSDETDRIRAVTREAMRETPEWVPDAPDEDLRDVAGHYLDAAGSEFLVGVADGTVVATGAYVPLDGWMADQFADADGDSTTAELTRMRVHPDAQGEGIGRAIYEKLESRASADGYGAFVLNTGAANDAARGFYEALGFDCERELSVTFEDVTLELALYRTALSADS